MPENPSFAIRESRGGQVPSLCVFLDTETNSQPGVRNGEVEETFRLAVAIMVRRDAGRWTRRTVRRFTSGDSLWGWVNELESVKRPVWLFGHNVGFDLTVSGFFDWLDRGIWSTRDVWPIRSFCGFESPGKRKPWRGSMVLTDPPTIMVLRSRQGSLRIVDTFNYWKGSVDALGKSVGVEKLAQPPAESSDELWFEYCQRDVEILERAVCGWVDKWAGLGCGSWKPTGAGLGYSAWRSSLNGLKIYPDHSEKQIEFARASYYGGQTEVFYRGPIYPDKRTTKRIIGRVPTDFDRCPSGPVYHLDIHALYPAVMAARSYPRKFVRFEGPIGVDRLDALSNFLLPIAKVLIGSTTDTYPVRRDGKYYHATGQFWTYLCGDELSGAIRRGHVLKVGEVAWYEPADLFSGFVSKWLGLRAEAEAEGDSVTAELCKLTTNSLSGKFAQKRIVWVERPDLYAAVRFGEWIGLDRDRGKMMRFRAIGGNVQEFTEPGEGRDSFPAISAHITANGRELMRGLRLACPPRTVLYQDTDSLFVLKDAMGSLGDALTPFRKLPGKLRIVDIYTWLEIRGFKFYGNDEWTVCPGLKKDAKMDEPGKWSQSRFQRLAEKLVSYSGPSITVKSDKFTPVGTLGNRSAGADGWTIPPVLTDPA